MHEPAAGCERWGGEISAYLDGELAAVDRAAVDAHLPGCPACASALRDLRMLTLDVGALADGPVPQGLADRILARVAREEAAGTAAPASRIAAVSPARWVRRAAPWAMAAGVAVALGAGVLPELLRTPQGERTVARLAPEALARRGRDRAETAPPSGAMPAAPETRMPDERGLREISGEEDLGVSENARGSRSDREIRARRAGAPVEAPTDEIAPSTGWVVVAADAPTRSRLMAALEKMAAPAASPDERRAALASLRGGEVPQAPAPAQSSPEQLQSRMQQSQEFAGDQRESDSANGDVTRKISEMLRQDLRRTPVDGEEGIPYVDLDLDPETYEVLRALLASGGGSSVLQAWSVDDAVAPASVRAQAEPPATGSRVLVRIWIADPDWARANLTIPDPTPDTLGE